ncbi:YybH family protein [Methylococcus mesophilus]|uniref:YybH family protein n=1 Tax=Methylococcus mesophilus TaxID=2993564 RepID=UPI00224AFD73|nr:SgcJ/EcaC family oxidoreductase [Methylococcus mesophilus]UZR27766.1 SgcJ/EcaC family oxidoreductase [Methylococcus mesophilus]
MNADELAIRNLVARWHSASEAGDVEAVLRLMDEDVVFLVAGHPPMKGRSAFEQGLRGLLALNRIETTSEIQEIEVSGHLAYCWSVLNVRVIPKVGGRPVVRSGSAVSILRKQTDGSWLVVRDVNLLAVVT